MYTKILSVAGAYTADASPDLRYFLPQFEWMYGPENDTVQVALRTAYLKSGYAELASRIADGLSEPLREARVRTVIERTVRELQASGMTSSEITNSGYDGFLDRLMLRYRHNGLLAVMTAHALAGQGYSAEGILKFFALLERYAPSAIAAMWPHLIMIVQLPVDPFSIFNEQHGGVFDSILARYQTDLKTRKFGWSYQLLRYGVPAERIYNRVGDGVLDQVSSRYANGVAQKVVTSLIGIARGSGRTVGVDGTFSGGAVPDVFYTFPKGYAVNDLPRLEVQLENERIRARSVRSVNVREIAGVEQSSEKLPDLTATISWTEAVRPTVLH